MTIVELLDALEEELEGSKKGFLSERRLVDADKCLDTLDEIRENLPLELERFRSRIRRGNFLAALSTYKLVQIRIVQNEFFFLRFQS